MRGARSYHGTFVGPVAALGPALFTIGAWR